MYKTVEAVLSPGGVVKFKEPIHFEVTQRILITLLDDDSVSKTKENAISLKFDWRGGLKDLNNQFDSVKLQHEIFKEWK
ncbi:MAG: hypothetical protein HQM15_00460 [Deltaproteobacteria bacterium]|nr:hypothetical protein [Deltaproteobacteria bacterium]